MGYPSGTQSHHQYYLVKMDKHEDFWLSPHIKIKGFAAREAALKKLKDAIKQKKSIRCDFGTFRWFELTNRVKHLLPPHKDEWPKDTRFDDLEEVPVNYLEYHPDLIISFDNRQDNIRQYEFSLLRRKHTKIAWTIHKTDDEDNRTFYFNSVTNKIQWSNPYSIHTPEEYVNVHWNDTAAQQYCPTTR